MSSYLDDLLPIDNHILIENIASDSRKVTSNSIFFCFDGFTYDGHTFCKEAIDKGAVCIVHQKELTEYIDGIIYYQSDDIVSLLASVCNKFYMNPSKYLKVVGITGTAGKTTVANLIYSISKNYLNMGYFGTRLVEYGAFRNEYQYTTPETIYLQKTLRNMADEEMDSVCIELSSQGLNLKRVEGVDFDIAIFTNMFQEHIDAHGSYEKYQEAKLSLFRNLKPSGIAIIDVDEPFSSTIQDVVQGEIFTYGIEQDADVMARNIEFSYEYTKFDLLYENNIIPLKLPIIGKVNVSHILASIACLLKLNMSLDEIVKGLQNVSKIEGHYEKIENNYGINILIDEGTHPKHYEELYKFAKSITKGKIISVFGCTGKKANARRELVGEITAKYADFAILTEEDCKDENVIDICDKIASKLQDKIPYVIIENREYAIYQALEKANKDDTILIIGKGRGKFLIRNEGKEFYIGDKQAVLDAIKNIYEIDEY